MASPSASAGAAADIWRGDAFRRIAEVQVRDTGLQHYAGMAYDADCMRLADSLAARYPALCFAAWFSGKGWHGKAGSRVGTPPIGSRTGYVDTGCSRAGDADFLSIAAAPGRWLYQNCNDRRFFLSALSCR